MRTIPFYSCPVYLFGALFTDDWSAIHLYPTGDARMIPDRCLPIYDRYPWAELLATYGAKNIRAVFEYGESKQSTKSREAEKRLIKWCRQKRIFWAPVFDGQ